MINSDILLTMAQTGNDVTSLFPFPFPLHVIFAIIALAFFVFRFIMEKKPFQLIFAVAVPFSLIIWVSNSRTLFYIVGLVEFVLLLAALITYFIFRDKSNDNTTKEEQKSEVQK